MQKFLDDMRQAGIPLHTPCLKLEVQGSEVYELEVDDIKEVFGVFGEVATVNVYSYGKALIMFKEVVPAYFAWKSLDGKILSSMGAKLMIE